MPLGPSTPTAIKTPLGSKWRCDLRAHGSGCRSRSRFRSLGLYSSAVAMLRPLGSERLPPAPCRSATASLYGKLCRLSCSRLSLQVPARDRRVLHWQARRRHRGHSLLDQDFAHQGAARKTASPYGPRDRKLRLPVTLTVHVAARGWSRVCVRVEVLDGLEVRVAVAVAVSVGVAVECDLFEAEAVGVGVCCARWKSLPRTAPSSQAERTSANDRNTVSSVSTAHQISPRLR